jgi:hypothetical protein
MNNDRGKAECVENYTKRQEVYRRLQELEQERRRVHTAEELEALEAGDSWVYGSGMCVAAGDAPASQLGL